MIRASTAHAVSRAWPGAVAFTVAAILHPLIGAAQSAPAQTTGDTPDSTQLEQVTVTGSRISGNGFSTPTPVSVVGADRAEQLATTNVGNLLNDLPSFRADATPSAPTGGYVGGRILDLRGLGAQRTLVLVDGQRFIPSTTVGTVDTNMIPSILLQRAEVVTGGASAAYGSDAVAGVVNFILDNKLNGVKADLTYGQSQRQDDKDRTAAIAGGSDFMGGRAHLTAAAEFEDNGGIGTCTEREWCAEEWLNFGRNPGQTNIPGNNILPHIRPSTIAITGVINASTYAKGSPALTTDPLHGIGFNPDGTPRAFQYGSMVNSLYMVGGEGEGHDAYFEGLPLMAPTQRYNLYSIGSFNFTDKVTGKLAVSFGHLLAHTEGVQYKNISTVITRDNPYLPTSTNPAFNIGSIMDADHINSFTLGRAYEDVGNPLTTAQNKVFRAVGSLQGELSGSWGWDGYYQFGRNELSIDTTGNDVVARFTNSIDSIKLPSGQIVCRINADANPNNDDPNCAPLNPFGNQVSAAARAYVTANSFQHNVTRENVVAANLHGDLFSTWAGPVGAATGVEYRADKIDGTTDPISQGLGFYAGNGSNLSGRLNVSEAYFEGEAPLAKDITLLKSVELNGAIRETHYDRNGLGQSSGVNATTWKLGLVWDLTDQFRLRGTRSRDIRAPNISELFGPTTTGFGILNDPARNGLQTNPVVRSGSNPKLVNEIADTWSGGIVWRPSGALDWMQLSVDYYDISVAEAIGTLGAQTIATRCYQGATEFCGLITRDANGVITQIVDVQQNVNKLITRGVDTEIDMHHQFDKIGNIDYRILFTYYSDLITQDSAGPVNRAGQTGLRAGTIPGVPRYILDTLLNWGAGPTSVSLHTRFIPEGIYNVAFVGPDQPGYSLANPASSNTNHVKSALYLDLIGHYHLHEFSKGSLEVFGGVNNLLDTDPPRVPGANGSGNNVYFSPIGRNYTVGVRYRQ